MRVTGLPWDESDRGISGVKYRAIRRFPHTSADPNGSIREMIGNSLQLVKQKDAKNPDSNSN